MRSIRNKYIVFLMAGALFFAQVTPVRASVGSQLSSIVKGTGAFLSSGSIASTVVSAFNTAGGLKFIRCGLTGTQLGLIVGTTLLGALATTLQQKWFNYLGLNSDLRMNGSVIQINTLTPGTVDPTTQAQATAEANRLAALGFTVTIYWFASWEGADAQYTTDRNSTTGRFRYSLGYASQGTNTNFSRFWYNHCNNETTKDYRWFAYPTGGGTYTPPSSGWSDATASKLGEKIAGDLAGSDANKKAAAQALAEAVIEELERQLQAEKVGTSVHAALAAALALFKSGIEANMSAPTKASITAPGEMDADVTSPEKAAAAEIVAAIKAANTVTVNPSFAGAGTWAAWPTAPTIASAFTTFMTNVKSTTLWALPGAMSTGFPSGGSSVISFDGGIFGYHSYDFASWGQGVFNALKGCVLVICSWVAIRITTKGGGG